MKSLRWSMIGVPSSAGSLFTGMEGAPAAYRAAGLVELARAGGADIEDVGDVSIPECLPRHNVPPIRNWPSPRIVWELLADDVARARSGGAGVLLVGGDCSVVVGAVPGLLGAGEEHLHVVCLDGHVDAVAPEPETCVGAAAMGLWLLTHRSAFWDGPLLQPARVTVLGAADLQGTESAVAVVPPIQVLEQEPIAVARELLEGLPPAAAVLVHFDVDVIREQEMPAAYSPNPDGLPLDVVEALLCAIVADERVVALEVPEYTVQRDLDGRHAGRIAALVARALSRRSAGQP